MVAERDYLRTSERIERLIVDALIPLIYEETVDVVSLISQEHIQRRIVEEPVDVSQDAIEDCNKDQLSNTTARIEAVEKSISELDERVTKDTEIRQKQHSEVMTLIANNAASTELPKPTSQTVQKTVEVPQVKYTDRIVGVPVTANRTAPVLWLSCEGQIDVRELVSENSYFCAIVDRQGHLVAAPVDLRT